MIILNWKTQKIISSLSQSSSSHSSHKPWLEQAQQWPLQEPQAPFSLQSVLADKTQEKKLAKKVVVEAEMVEEEVVEEEVVTEKVAI